MPWSLPRGDEFYSTAWDWEDIGHDIVTRGVIAECLVEEFGINVDRAASGAEHHFRTWSDIAETVGMGQKAVQAVAYEALGKIRAALEDDGFDPDA